MRISIIIILFVLPFQLHAQATVTPAMVKRLADSLYQKGNFLLATDYYLQVSELSDFKTGKGNALYNAACCLALQQKTDSAFIILELAIRTTSVDKAALTNDQDLQVLHKDPRWNKIVSRLKAVKSLNDNPDKVIFFTKDVNNFWRAYDKALKDTSRFREIFKKYYFDKASEGMNDYMGYKVSSIDNFIKHIKTCPGFYRSIKDATLSVDRYKKEFYASFRTFKELYPPAKFPDIYFVIGALTSGGTVSNNGLLIGVNQIANTSNTVTRELTPAQLTRLNDVVVLPGIIAHELIHFQQYGMANDTTTLSFAIKEGMADFMGELISGTTVNDRLYQWARGKEKQIWNKFKHDMFLNKYSDWMANSSQATADNLPDQGYWIGYQICKAYYEKAANKKAAINEMLHIQDYKAFLKKSGWEEKLELMQ
jgi:hypothetical protein